MTQEIVCPPSSPRHGLLFDLETQAYARLLFEQYDWANYLWHKFNICGPTQSGKSLCAMVIPAMYHLFELQENVIVGVPTGDMMKDKWEIDFLPVIESSQYKRYLPTSGAGSKGGTGTLIKFKNGARLKFMTAGGGTKSRAGFTSRVLVITETDGFDEVQETSKEGRKIDQLYGRTKAHKDRALIYQECTVSVEKALTWSTYNAGSQSRIFRPCFHCKGWVSPEREHLLGWQEAKSAKEAKEKAYWSCPNCGHAWTDAERLFANRESKLVHRWQEILADGTVRDKEGMSQDTDVLGFRWSAVDNSFQDASTIGQREWLAMRDSSPDEKEIEIRQQDFATPAPNPEELITALDYVKIAERITEWPRGIVPTNVNLITMGVDLGQRLLHWTAIGWESHARGHIIDYGVKQVHSDELGVEPALLLAMREFRDDVCKVGFKRHHDDVDGILPRFTLFDAGYWDTVVHAFVNEPASMNLCYASKGFGASQDGFKSRYHEPSKDGTGTAGEKWKAVMIAQKGWLIEFDTDHWKAFVRSRLAVPREHESTFTLFRADPSKHFTFGRHICSEDAGIVFKKGKGNLLTFEKKHKHNHWFDSTVMASVAGNMAGVRLMVQNVEPEVRKPLVTPRAPVRRPDGREWLQR